MDRAQLKLVLDAQNNLRGPINNAKQDLNKLSQAGADVGKNMSRGLDGVANSLTSVGKNASIASAALGAGFIKSIGLWRQQKEAVDLVDNSIKRLGPDANVTSQQLQNMASEFQKMSNYGDEDILANVTTQLLTFKDIAGGTPEEFRMIQQSVLDVAATLGMEGPQMQELAISFGKALENPAEGMKKLARRGIEFSEADEQMVEQLVESGDVLGAREYMLQKIGENYGGAAQAAIDPWKQFSNTFGDLLEEVGRIAEEYLLPVLARIKGWIERFQTLDDKTKRIIVVVGLLAAAIGPLLLGLGMAAKAILAVRSAMLVLNTAFLMNPITWIILGIIAVIALLYLNWDKLVVFFKWAWKVIKNAFLSGAVFITNRFGDLIGAVKAYAAVYVWFKDVFAGVWTYIKNVLKGVADVFSAFTNYIKATFKAIPAAIKSVFLDAFNWVLNKAKGFINKFIDMANKIPGVNIGRLGTMKQFKLGADDTSAIHEAARARTRFGGALQGLGSTARDFSPITSVVKDFPNRIRKAFGEGSKFVSPMVQLLEGMKEEGASLADLSNALYELDRKKRAEKDQQEADQKAEVKRLRDEAKAEQQKIEDEIKADIKSKEQTQADEDAAKEAKRAADDEAKRIKDRREALELLAAEGKANDALEVARIKLQYAKDHAEKMALTKQISDMEKQKERQDEINKQREEVFDEEQKEIERRQKLNKKRNEAFDLLEAEGDPVTELEKAIRELDAARIMLRTAFSHDEKVHWTANISRLEKRVDAARDAQRQTEKDNRESERQDEKNIRESNQAREREDDRRKRREIAEAELRARGLHNDTLERKKLALRFTESHSEKLSLIAEIGRLEAAKKAKEEQERSGSTTPTVPGQTPTRTPTNRTISGGLIFNNAVINIVADSIEDFIEQLRRQTELGLQGDSSGTV